MPKRKETYLGYEVSRGGGVKKSIYDFRFPVSVHLSSYQQKEVREILNVLYVGDKHVNKRSKDGVMVGIYDNHPKFKALRETHYSVAGSTRFDLKMGVDKNGRLFIKGFEK